MSVKFVLGRSLLSAGAQVLACDSRRPKFARHVQS